MIDSVTTKLLFSTRQFSDKSFPVWFDGLLSVILVNTTIPGSMLKLYVWETRKKIGITEYAQATMYFM